MNHDPNQPERQDCLRTQMSENLRTEYQALCSYFGNIITFRFMVLGFFLAAVGLIVSSEKVPTPGPILIAFAASIWLIDIRNRVLMYQLLQRVRKIENLWRAEAPTYFPIALGHHYLWRNRVRIRFFWRKRYAGPRDILGKAGTHSGGIDLILALTVLYGLALTALSVIRACT